MPTKYPEIFAQLAAPFQKSELKTRPGSKGVQLTYITARTVLNRLDDVLGPENWSAEYVPFGQDSVLCKLTIHLPDGSTVTKQGVGGRAGMEDRGDDDKSGVSDSLKRAAVECGVARYLYRDGVPQFVRDIVKPQGGQRPRESQDSQEGDRGRQAVNEQFKPAEAKAALKPPMSEFTPQELAKAGRELWDWASQLPFEAKQWFVGALDKKGKTLPPGYENIVHHEQHALNHLVKWAVAQELVVLPVGFKHAPNETVELLRPLWIKQGEQMRVEVWRWIKVDRPAQIKEEIERKERRTAAVGSNDDPEA